MPNVFDNLVEVAFDATEKNFRELIFSKGNSVLVPIWLISDISNINIKDKNFLDNQHPYIEKGFDIPRNVIPNIIDEPLYVHIINK